MNHPIFIAGIGTDVGKTVVSAIFAEALKADYWKPIQAGNINSSDKDAVKKLISNSKSVFLSETYILKEPISPHTSAAMEGIEINFEKIILPKTKNQLIIEGAGGLLVPINNKHFMIDLIRKFNADVILVIKNYLGCVNHSLLSIEALQRRRIPIKGIVFNGTDFSSSEKIILQKSGLNCLLKIETEKKINKKTILKYSTKLNIKDLL